MKESLPLSRAPRQKPWKNMTTPRTTICGDTGMTQVTAGRELTELATTLIELHYSTDTMMKKNQVTI